MITIGIHLGGVHPKRLPSMAMVVVVKLHPICTKFQTRQELVEILTTTLTILRTTIVVQGINQRIPLAVIRDPLSKLVSSITTTIHLYKGRHSVIMLTI